MISQLLSNPWVYYTFWVLYALTIVSIIVVLLSENRNPVKSLAWVTVLVLLPVFGLVLYLFFGRSIKNTRMISRRNRRRLRKQEGNRKAKHAKLDLSPEGQQLVQLGRSLLSAPYYTGNHVDIFTDGQAKFDALLRDIAQAKHSINIQYYIISDDRIGQRLKDALVEKARQGVTVRVIYDHVGSFKTRNRFFREMREAGIQAFPFFKVAFPPFGTRINWRNHRKLCIIDGAIGYIGGMNVADRYIDGGKKFASWRDTHIRVTGPAVNALHYSFAVDWNFMGQPLIGLPSTDSPAVASTGDAGMMLLTSGPTSQWTNIAFMFLKAIADAKKRVYLQTPYFLPNDSLLRALQTAALAGVDVRVMIPAKSDSAMLTNASSSYIAECLQAGIKIYLYRGGMLHAKTLVVDYELSSIGSTNFDFRSFEHNFEANMQIFSRDVNERMAAIFKADMEQSERVNLAQWKRRPLPERIAQSAIRLLSPIL